MTAPPERTALLGLDIGTTRCKLIGYTAEGGRIAGASASYALFHPKPGWAELDAGEMLAAVRQVFAAMAPRLDGFGRLILAISAQGEAFALVDRMGRVLAPMPVSIDRRGLEAIAGLRADPVAAQAARAAGQNLTALTSLAKLLWFRDAIESRFAANRFAGVDKFLCVGELVMRHLGLSPIMDHSMASRTGLLDVPRKIWSPELLRLTGLPSRLLPDLAPSGRHVGTVPARRMATLGLDREVAVYLGGHDQACALLGAGIADRTTALYSIGTTEAIALPTAAPTHEFTDLHITPYPHVVAGQYVLLFGSQNGGRVLPWLAGLLGREEAADILANLPGLPSALMLVPHLAGSGTILADEAARGIILGLDYSVTPEAVQLAALEGVTLEQASGLSRLADRGVRISALRAVGGGARSDRWLQIKSDIIGLPIDRLSEADTACAGAAILAGLGAGIFGSADDAVSRFVTTDRRFEPRSALREVYALKRTLYARAYESIASLRTLTADLERAVARLSCETLESE